MKRDTKKIILLAAKKLFNKNGYVNVRLQQIATEAGLSVGNMAYHYKHKSEMLLAIFENLQVEQQVLLGEIHLTPVFENLDYFFKSIFELQQNYLFVYQDTLELIRASEVLKIAYRDHLKWQEMQLEMILEMNKARGALTWVAEDDVVSLARQLRRGLDNWHYAQEVQGLSAKTFELYRKDMWAIIAPFFTDIGEREFDQLNYSVAP